MERPSSIAPEMDGGLTDMPTRGAMYDNFMEAAAWFAKESAKVFPEHSTSSESETPDQIWEVVLGLMTKETGDAIREAAANIFVEQGMDEGGVGQLQDVHAVSQLGWPSLEDPLQHRLLDSGTNGPMSDVFHHQHLIPAGGQQSFQTGWSHQTTFEPAEGHANFDVPSIPLEDLDVLGIDARVQEEYNALIHSSEGHVPYHLSANWDLSQSVWEPVVEDQMAPEAFERSPQSPFRGASFGRSLTRTHSLDTALFIRPAETFAINLHLFFRDPIASATGPVRSEKSRMGRNVGIAKGPRPNIATKQEDWPQDRHWFKRGHLREEQEKLAEAVGVTFVMMAPILLQETELLRCRWDMGRGRQCGREVTREGLFQHYHIFHEVLEVDGRVTCRQIDSEGGTCGDTLTIACMERHLAKAHYKLVAQCPLCLHQSTAPAAILKHIRSCKKYAGRMGSIW